MTPDRPAPPDAVTCRPVDGIGEVRPGEDLAATLATVLAGPTNGLADGDVLVLTSKVVSKAEGRLVRQDRTQALAGETARVVARRGATTIVRTHHGLVMAGGGIDASNTERGTSLLLPVDPDASARVIRERIAELTGCNVAVVVTDTAGRAWRHGQTDLAIGAAGVAVLHDYTGAHDDHGNELRVTAPAVADEMAAAADLVKGKLARRPAAVLRGLGEWVLPRGEHGAGATALVRPEDQDMFGIGAREAALAALSGDEAQRSGFGRPAAEAELVQVLTGLGAPATAGAGHVDVLLPDADARSLGRVEATLVAAAFALGWRLAGEPGTGHDRGTALRFVPATP